MEKKDEKKPELKKRELDFEMCYVHNIRYPKGGQCPRCKLN